MSPTFWRPSTLVARAHPIPIHHQSSPLIEENPFADRSAAIDKATAEDCRLQTANCRLLTSEEANWFGF